MPARENRWIALGAAAALAAAGLGVWLSAGEVDAPAPPPIGPGGTPPPPPPGGGLPALSLSADFPPAAAKPLRDAWAIAATAGPASVAAALDALAPPAGGGPLAGAEARAIEAFAPILEHLAVHGEQPVPAAALRCAAGLARSGGADARAALQRSGLVSRAFAVQAHTGPEEHRREAARLLGVCGGPQAAAWLASVVEKAPEDSVRESAIHALVAVHRGGTRLGAEPVAAVRAALRDSAGRPALRRACLGAIRGAKPDFLAWFQDGTFVEEIVACLGDPDPSVRYETALFLDACPLEASGPALVRAVREDREERVVGKAADALAQVRPPGAAEALAARLPSLRDPEAIRSVEAAIRSLGRR